MDKERKNPIALFRPADFPANGSGPGEDGESVRVVWDDRGRKAADLVRDCVAQLERRLHELFPRWYGLEFPEKGKKDPGEFDWGAEIVKKARTIPEADLVWLNSALRRQSRRLPPPFADNLPLEIQLRQSELALFNKLEIIRIILDSRTTDDYRRLKAFSKGVLWLSDKSSSAVEVHIPDNLKDHPGLETVLNYAGDFHPVETSPGEPPKKRDEAEAAPSNGGGNSREKPEGGKKLGSEEKEDEAENAKAKGEEESGEGTPASRRDERGKGKPGAEGSDGRPRERRISEEGGEEAEAGKPSKKWGTKAPGFPDITGAPHPLSLGEKLLSARISQDPFLKPLFTFNTPVTTRDGSKFIVDLLWRKGRLVVEVDSYRHHGHKKAFREDRRRDYLLFLSGYQVLRLTTGEIKKSVKDAAKKIENVVKFIAKKNR
ncbi:MAG: DUF559 domain-containing protein [Deltaproteobacteria bacterium]|jgi:very-short-patch-repair endonuclease|nr:DUF559 domain-containing protein [Deltaproteobacteria bacterium]